MNQTREMEPRSLPVLGRCSECDTALLFSSELATGLCVPCQDETFYVRGGMRVVAAALICTVCAVVGGVVMLAAWMGVL